MSGGEPAQQTSGAQDSNLDPIVAALISMFIPGVGHYLGGLEQRGIYWFAGTAVAYLIVFISMFLLIGFLLMFFLPLIHIGAGIDAYLQLND